ncbi:MAG: competence/damage-inducible protein A [Acidimicrobiia bacterium]|nr:competence/damage-inducible protein A [Acidimicrobiia bacterium]
MAGGGNNRQLRNRSHRPGLSSQRERVRPEPDVIVEVLAVGTELLLGQTVNTNASYLGEKLAELGVDAHYQTVVGDNHDRLVDAIHTAVGRADALIITGGLGPTQDDITRAAIGAATHRRMLFSEEAAARLRKFWKQMDRPFPESNLCQAEYPEGAEQLPNPRGTAPGLYLEHQNTKLFALPGVPAELRPMVDAQVIPRLRQSAGEDGVLVSRVLRTWGYGESLVAVLLDDLYHASTNPSMAFLASAGEVKIRLTAKAGSDREALALIEPLEAEVRDRLGAAVFSVDDQTLEQILLDILRERGWTIGTAESVTSGLVATRLSLTEGSSEVFRGSIVAYAGKVKQSLLGVTTQTVETYGVVSPETALAMAEGAARVLDVDVAVATTGVAGPDYLDYPPGTVSVAVRTPLDARTKLLRLPGDRERVRAYATTTALHLTRLGILGEWWED